MKYEIINQMKDEIIFNVLNYLDSNDKTDANKAKYGLQEFAKAFNFTIKKQVKPDTKEALKQFVINKKGYPETVTRLFNSL